MMSGMTASAWPHRGPYTDFDRANAGRPAAPLPYPLAATPAPAPPPAPLPAQAPSAEIRVGPNGYIHGVDGMLDQIAAALSRHAGPMIVRDVLPAVRADRQLQARVGAVVGQAIAQTLQPYLLVGAGALAILAAIQLGRWHREQRPTARRGPSR